MAITASSPLVQRYFDQGLRLIYAFNHDEAIRAFEAAQKLDPDCAMCFWGVAVALGPNINLPMDASANPRALAAVSEAEKRAPRASEREQAYIAAISARYSAAPDADRASLDKSYAAAMGELAKRYPDDLDAATLYAEALMDLRPWDYWKKDGTPNEGTAEIVAQLERVLAKDASHPGANHYYIHATEASPDPGRAVPSAQRLETLAPTAGHLVHMSAHTYMRVGRYHEASVANERGARADESYMAWCKSGGFYPFAYYPHNLHFLWTSEAFEGRSAASLATSKKLAESVTADVARQAPPAQEIYAIRFFAPVRFGKWEQALVEPAPPDDLPYALGMYHWARGMALANTGKLDQARGEQAALAQIAAGEAVAKLEFLEGSAAQLLEIASHMLAGEIARKQGNSDAALAELDAAQRAEYALRYSEPPGWPLPVRQYQGAALLEFGRAADAEVAFRDDLVEYPENGWSLFGLAAALRAQRKPVVEVEHRFLAAWAAADVKLERSRF
ncbi:MAG TPA: hypothetical protein VEN47_05365 [Myxococcota bacterium]|nr:hypothetical protein [Myxococcota bacterium]